MEVDGAAALQSEGWEAEGDPSRVPPGAMQLSGGTHSPVPLVGPSAAPHAAHAPRRAGTRGIFSLEKRHGTGE